MGKKKNLYDVLGVDKNATDGDIKKAFRDKAKKAHTDKGGAKDEMQELNNAYAVLKIASKRDHYDRTGETKDTPFDKKFHGFIQTVFVETIIKQTRNVETEDLIKTFRAFIDDLVEKNEEELKLAKVEIVTMEKVISNLKSKKDNLITIVLQQNLVELKNKLGQL